jgi:electron transport complex protein RnfC
MNIISAIKRFRGGVHPRDGKALASGQPLRELPVPPLLTISLSQHLGAPAVPCVKVGDRVIAGQRIADAKGPISANIHAPVCGTVKQILASAPTPAARTAPAIVLATEPDATDRDESLSPIPDWVSKPPAELVERIREAGVVGMGGAGFPTAVKLTPTKPIDTLIVNGAECEPYLNADYRLMLEQPDLVWEGVRILRHILHVDRVRILIEDNKPGAIEKMAHAIHGAEGDVAIVRLDTLYPQGGEKQQIYSATGRIIPMGALPMEIGCVVDNVATAKAVRDAVVEGRPLTHRAITVTGEAVVSPGNFVAPIGTSFADLLAAAGGTKGDVAKIISGGPMMGFALPSADVGMTKTSSGILFFPPELVTSYSSQACISCGRCIKACPVGLMPAEISQAVEANDIDLADKHHVADCFECGCCAYVCPAHRPLVQHNRRAKSILRERALAAKQK